MEFSPKTNPNRPSFTFSMETSFKASYRTGNGMEKVHTDTPQEITTLEGLKLAKNMGLEK